MNILALEVSTSSAKSIIYSTEKGVIDSYSLTFDSKVGDVAIQDPEKVIKKIINCAKKVLQNKDFNIEIIGLSSTWHSFLLLDKNRKPITKIRTWADTSAYRTVNKYKSDKNLYYNIYKKTGCPIHSLYPLWKWIDFRENNNTSSLNNIYLSSKPEYIFEYLTGEIAVSKSVASGSGFMNIHDINWDKDILNLAKININQLSKLKNIDFSAPLKNNIAEELGLKNGTPVIITGPDGALNQIGSGALKNKIMTLSVGTSGAIRMVTPKPLIPKEPSTWCYYVGDNKRLAGAATSGAGNCIEWFKNDINNNQFTLDVLNKKAQNIKKSNAPIFLPFLYGERCPGWQDEKKGGFCELKGTHNLDHLYYSILEGILFNLYQSYKILVNVDDKPSSIKISGGIVNSDFWLQMAADIFQKNIIISKIKDASLMGVIAICLKKTGYIIDLEEFEPEAGGTINFNKDNIDLYNRRYKKYLKWYNVD